MTREGVRESRLREYSFCRKWLSVEQGKTGFSRWTQPPRDTDDQTQLTSDLGILTEAPLRHKDGYVTVATVPEVLHSKSNAPTGKVVLEAVPVTEGIHAQDPGGLQYQPLSSCLQNTQRGLSILPPQNPVPPATYTMATLLPSMTI